jgi:hypothetical protein
MATFHRRWAHGCRAASLALALAACGFAHAGGDFVEHRVQPGDTLEALSAQYLGSPRLWQRLQAHNQVGNPRHLQPGTVLRIPAELLPMGSARVSFVQGDARVLLPGAADPVVLQTGQDLPEGARVQVPADGFINVRLSDGTMIRVQADSDVRLQQLRRRGRAGDAQSVLELQRGSVESTVPPSQGGARRFEIRTPMASTSVRGTRFAVQLQGDGRTLAAVTEGTVAVDQRQAARAAGASPTQVRGGQGVAVSADGTVGAPQALLPAPDLSALPASVHDADFLSLALTPVAGAVAYQVQVARDADLTEVLRSGAFPTPALRLRAVEDGHYHIAVRAVDATGLPGLPARRAITVKAHPVPPLYQAPSAGGTLSRTQGALACTAVVGVARYRIQVAQDENFAAPVLDTTAPDCGAQVAALAPGRYHWRAASIRELPGGAQDQGPYALPQAFTVAGGAGPELPRAGLGQRGLLRAAGGRTAGGARMVVHHPAAGRLFRAHPDPRPLGAGERLLHPAPGARAAPGALGRGPARHRGGRPPAVAPLSSMSARPAAARAARAAARCAGAAR